MRKNIFYLFSFLLALFATFTADAASQASMATKVKGAAISTETAVQSPEIADKFFRPISSMIKPQHALLSIPMTGENIMSKNLMPGQAIQKVYAESSVIDLKGALLYSSDSSADQGVYNIPTSEGSLTAFNTDIVPEYGASYVNGKFYCVNTFSLNGTIYLAYIETYDAETWEQENSVTTTNFSLLAVSTAVDPTTNSVYGCFYNSTLTGYEFGIIDYAAGSRTTIASLSTPWNAMGADAEGNLYAIDFSGTLYSVDKSTGATTTIGSTGVTPQYMSGGVIDSQSGTFFWSVCTDASSSLYTVDTATATATKLYDFANSEQVAFPFILPPAAEDGAPAAVTDLTATFVDASLTGTVSFTAPTTTYDGTAATGSLSYTVYCDGTQVATGTTSCGASVSEEVTVAAPGTYQFSVRTSNSVGQSPETSTSLYVGSDTPNAPISATLTYADGMMSLSWYGVYSSVNGGYFDYTQVTYNVIRYPDETVVAEGLTTRSFSEAFTEPEELTIVSYAVEAVFNGMVSEQTRSNYLSFGSIYPPFTETFDDEGSFTPYTVIDVNEDGRTWSYSSGSARYRYSSSNAADDWLITPAIMLEAGNLYRVSFDARAFSSAFPERIEVKFGRECSVEGMTETVLESTDLTSGTSVTFTYDLAASESGVYYIGFHAVSDKDEFYMYLDNITIGAAESASVPSAVTDLVATPDPDGGKTAVLTFKAPTTDLVGNALSDPLTKIEISRDGTVLNTIESPTAGAEYSYSEEFTADGTYSYTVVAYNASGAGASATTSCYVGVPAPTAPTNVTIAETSTPGEVTISWEAPETPTNPAFVTYAVSDTDGNILVQGLTETSYTFQAVEAGNQDFVQYAVYAVTSGGSAYTVTDLIAAGTPYSLPFVESFADTSLSYIMATGESASNGAWGIYGDTSINGITSSDGDNGFAAMYGQSVGAAASLWTGKISLDGVANPALTVDMFNTVGTIANTNTLDILVSADGGDTWTSVSYTTFSELEAEAGWYTSIINLSAYAGQTISVKFTATVNAYTLISIDNIRITNLEDYSLTAVSISAPSIVGSNEDFDVTAKVLNGGAKTAEGFSVTLYRNGAAVATQEGLSLGSGETATYSFTQNYAPVEETSNEFYAVVTYAADANQDDNTTETVTTTMVLPVVPAPTDLKASLEDGASAVELTWNAPDMSQLPAVTTAVDFEDAESWAITYGDWTFVDVDGANAGGFNGIEIPNHPVGSPDGFFVFDQTDSSTFNSTFAANSGVKYLASMFNYDGSATDNWAISPKLCGLPQTVTFYAKSYSSTYPEAIQVDYSTTGNAQADFTSTALIIDEVSGDWTQYSFDLPAGATYFVIRSVATDAFMLMVDDVAYAGEGAEAGTATVQGYNVYRDKVKINDALVTSTAYSDASGFTADSKYVVTVVYAEYGESAGSNEAGINQGSVGTVSAAAVKAYAANGNIIVDNAAGQVINVFTADGRRMASVIGSQKTVIPATQGVYLVKAGAKAVKVIVK